MTLVHVPPVTSYILTNGSSFTKSMNDQTQVADLTSLAGLSLKDTAAITFY